MPEYITIDVEGGSFDAIAAGPDDGRPVMLLHGFPEAGSAWDYQVNILGSLGWRAVAPDQRGYSPKMRPESRNEYGTSELVNDVFAIADHFQWNKFDLIGHNIGGTISWLCAAENP